MKKRMKLIILGAGISGLSLAFWIYKNRKEEFDVALIEQRSEPGGWICSLNEQEFFFERGPRSLRPGPDTLQLIEDLGLQDEVIIPANDAKKRYLYCQAALHLLPNTLMGFLSSPLFDGLKWKVLKGLLYSSSPQSDESIEEFFATRFSPSFAEQFVDPLVSGIFAGNKRQLSMESCFPHIFAKAKEGRLINALWGNSKKQDAVSPWKAKIKETPLFSFRKGIGQMIDKLRESLPYPIYFDQKVIGIKADGSIQTDKELFSGDLVVSTLPWTELQSMLQMHDPVLAEHLSEVPFVSVKQVHLGYKKGNLLPKGFGYLVPTQEKEPIMGAVFDSEVFPEHNSRPDETRLTVMLGGAQNPNIIHYSNEQVIAIAKNAIARHVHIKQEPDLAFVTFCPHAIAQYPVGFQTLKHKIQERLSTCLPGWHLLGSSSDGVGVNDCITASRQLAVRL